MLRVLHENPGAYHKPDDPTVGTFLRWCVPAQHWRHVVSIMSMAIGRFHYSPILKLPLSVSTPNWIFCEEFMNEARILISTPEERNAFNALVSALDENRPVLWNSHTTQAVELRKELDNQRRRMYKEQLASGGAPVPSWSELRK